MDSNVFEADSPFGFRIPNVNNVADYVLQKLKTGADVGRTNCITDSLTGESFSCSEVIQYAHAVKLFLMRNGFKRGDTAIYSSHHGSRLHIFLLGVWLANGIVRSSYPEDVVDELINQLVESDSKWILCDDEFASENLRVASEMPWNVNVIVSGKSEECMSLEDVFLVANKENHPASVDPTNTLLTDTALILPTSGTTGSSKGAVFTHEQLLKNILMLEQMPFVDGPESPFLLASKMTHASGTTIPLSQISAGRKLILNSKPTLDNLMQSIDKYKAYGLLVFPKFLMCLAEASGCEGSIQWDISSLKCAVTAGQSLKESQLSFMTKRLNLNRFIMLYGMTEIGAISTNVFWRDFKLGNHEVIKDFPETSCGRLVPGTRLLVKDIQSGIPLSPNLVGEIYVISSLGYKGYLNNPEADEEAFVNGWFRTGDMGYVDQKGFVFVTGRRKEIFKYFNNHICPTDLEKILLKHPLVKEAVVVGVPDPDGGDSIPRGFVVLKQNDLGEDTANAIRSFFDGKVATYKRMRGGLFILNQLPHGKSGKLLKSALYNYKDAA